ncbi:MAG: helix-turn-helix domain-containing protein [Candidatus Diapherotrites archaeon]|nr:helix-turn-helix domain-containing protein [Candidatus Diapherotrites archaeon]MDZ4256505.1 helix-turn-helix domain-containing protein [archaeon]
MPPAECLVHTTTHSLGKRFAIPLLEELKISKEVGFNDLARKLHASPKMLSQRVKEMEEEGLVFRNARHHYTLTPKGMELSAVVDAIKRFHIKWKNVPEDCLTTNCVDCGMGKKKQALTIPVLPHYS